MMRTAAVFWHPTMTAFDACIRELLMQGTEDWVHAALLAWIAQSPGGATSPEAQRTLSIRLITEVLIKGYMEIGETTAGRGANAFGKWDVPMDEAISRVEREWKHPEELPVTRLMSYPQPGDICWLSNTSLGDSLGRQFLSERLHERPTE